MFVQKINSHLYFQQELLTNYSGESEPAQKDTMTEFCRHVYRFNKVCATANIH